MDELTTTDEIKATYPSYLYLPFLTQYKVPDKVSEEIMSTLIAVNLLLLIHSDYRDHLKYSEIITSYTETKDKILLLNDDLNKNKKKITDFRKLLYKNNWQAIMDVISNKYGVTELYTETILNYSLTCTRIYLHNSVKKNKYNVRGIINCLEKDILLLNEKLSPELIFSIKEIYKTNRRRSTSYSRGGIIKDSYAIYYPIVVVFIILAVYFYYYYTLIQ